MPRSGYISEIRQLVGSRRLLIPSVTLCIFDDRGRLLLLRHDDGDLWSTPGGTIEPDESPAAAAVREAREELHIRIETTHIIGVFGGRGFDVQYDNGDITSYVMTAFRCDVLEGELEPDGVEVHEAMFVGADDWPLLSTPGWLHKVLPEIYAWARSDDTAARFTRA